MSQDTVLKHAAAAEKQRAAKAGKTNQKGGLHVDVIDRLDYSGVGPASEYNLPVSQTLPPKPIVVRATRQVPMLTSLHHSAFHHDGPFDACAPSRNRHRTKAPMLAWTPSAEQPHGPDGILGVPTNDKPLSPLAQAPLSALHNNDGPYAAAASPGLKKSKTTAGKELPAIPADIDRYFPNTRPTSPKRRETLAEAWGKGEPEPFEEFFAGGVSSAVQGNGDTGLASAASSIYGGKTGPPEPTSQTKRRPTNGVRRATNRPPLPPPKPIFPPEPSADEGPHSAEAGSTTFSTSPGASAPKRSKSLIHRIRRMRDQPNVPVAYEEAPENEASTGSSSENYAPRPTHKPQNSLLGKFGKLSPTSPTPPGALTSRQDDEKSLPASPGSPRFEQDGYFSSSATLGRKGSIMQRVRGVVGRAR